MTADWLLADVVLVPMDGPPAAPLGHVRRGAVRVRGGRIAALGDLRPEPGEEVVDGAGRHALPGFVQGHVHCCQTLFRGLADDLPLLEWLRTRTWPIEHAMDAAATTASAELTCCELLRSGTTTVQTIESVRHAECAAEVLRAFGLLAITGNSLMDLDDGGAPPGMALGRADSLRVSEQLAAWCDGRDGRPHYAVSPRFVLSCSDALLRDAGALARDRGLRVHTHAGEHPSEGEAVRARFGRDAIEVLHDLGLLGERTGLAHCVHTGARERELLVATRTAVLHCPSANLKLGSGLAPIARYRELGLRVALGADGAPCNNRLSALTELRTAALLQAVAAGPGAFPAAAALWTATAGGAAALGLAHEVGSLRPGLRADLCLFDLGDPSLAPGGDLCSAVVYSADERHLRDVVVGGRFAVRDGELRTRDHAAVAAAAAARRDEVLTRAGLRR
ncbi:MAG: amidohydrolase family protein [Planctomycetota bacterium]